MSAEERKDEDVGQAFMPPQVQQLLELLGEVVLIPIPWGRKGPVLPGWQKKTLRDMKDADYLGLLGCGNIGVLTGSPSSNVCSIDIDRDDQVEEFLASNPKLATTLRTRGKRGCNLWPRIIGEYPPAGKLKHQTRRNPDGSPLDLGEWRADGNQTVIFGRHPSGTDYSMVVRSNPVTIRFDEIVWPPGWRLPWMTEQQPGGVEGEDGGESASAANGQDVPMIVLPSHDVTITETAERLFAEIAKSRSLFARGQTVTEVARSDDGSLILKPVLPQGFRSRAEQFASLFAWRKDGQGDWVLKPTCMSVDTAAALLASIAVQANLPRIRGIFRCPVLTASDGVARVVSGGYDDLTGILVVAGAAPPDVTLEVAVSSLTDLVAEFQFQSLGDRSRAIAALITPALRFGSHIRGPIPAEVAEADESQAGKTFWLKMLAAIYNEAPTLITQKKGGVGSDDETFNSALLTGRPFLLFDNRRDKFDSTHLEAFLTSPGFFPARVPHLGTVQIDPTAFMVGMTSNGVETTPDFANRSSIVRIRKKQGYTFKRFPEGDLFDHVRANQPFLLGCVFRVVTTWLDAGKPRTSETRHDMREWCQSLDWIVQNLFGEVPLMDGHRVAQTRVSNPSLTFVRNIGVLLCKLGKLGLPVSASEIYGFADENGIPVPHLRAADERSGAKLVGAAMGKVFGDADQVVVEGLTIERCSKSHERPDGKGWVDLKSYIFRKEGSVDDAAPGKPSKPYNA